MTRARRVAPLLTAAAASPQVKWGWGVVVNVSRSNTVAPTASAAEGGEGGGEGGAVAVDSSNCYVADVLVCVDSETLRSGAPKPAEPGER